MMKPKLFNFQNIQTAHTTLKTNNLIKKWAEDLKHISPKKTQRWTVDTWKKCSMSLIIKEMQVKTTRHHLTLIRMTLNDTLSRGL